MDTLQWLDFDYSEDADGHGTFDALASVPAARLDALHAEIARVLGWAHEAFPHACAPREEGGEWQYDLSGRCETSAPQTLDYDAGTGRIAMRTGMPAPPRHTVGLSLAGSEGFCTAFRTAFRLED